jgi:hypothetical protein
MSEQKCLRSSVRCNLIHTNLQGGFADLGISVHMLSQLRQFALEGEGVYQ